MCPRDLRVSDVCRSSAGESLFHFAGRLLLRHRHSSCVLLLKIAHSGCMPGLFVPASALPWRGSQAGGPAGLGWEKHWAVPWTELFLKEPYEGQSRGGQRASAIILLQGGFATKKGLLIWSSETRERFHSLPAFLRAIYALVSHTLTA